MPFTKLFLLTLICTLFSVHAFAKVAKPRRVATIKNWQIYISKQKNDQVCFMISRPIRKSGNYNKRYQQYLIINNIASNIDEVSVNSGYKYSSKSIRMIISTDKKFNYQKLLTSGKRGKCFYNKKDVFKYNLDVVDKDTAWLDETIKDHNAIQNMKHGYYLLVSAKSPQHFCSIDIYSLEGFTAAYQKMKKVCNAK